MLPISTQLERAEMYHLGMPNVSSNFFLSFKNQNQAQNNAVVYQIDKIDYVRFEPMTSTMPATFYQRSAMRREILTGQIPSAPLSFFIFPSM